MGTTYRSALSWDLETTAVELVPGVRDAFGFYHADAGDYLRHPKGRIVVDDGRRYLKRTPGKYDLIVIDPPPPVEAAGSSLLYSDEFYGLVKEHLNPRGILQTWLPGGEVRTGQAILRSVVDSFHYVRCFLALEEQGLHILASMEPIEVVSVEELVSRMPEGARKDLLEWSPSETLPNYWRAMLALEIQVQNTLSSDLAIRVTDDRPYNEYFFLREWGPQTATGEATGP